MTGKHIWSDAWKGRLWVSSPLLGGEGSRCRNIPDRRVQVHIIRWSEGDPAIDYIFGEYFLFLDLHLAPKETISPRVTGKKEMRCFEHKSLREV